MKLQVKLKYAKDIVIINNVEYITYDKIGRKVHIKEYINNYCYYIPTSDILALSVYDLQKGGVIK